MKEYNIKNLIKKLTILSLFYLAVSCEEPTSPAHINFGEFEATYTITGGWINTTKLFIYKTGKVRAEIRSSASYAILDSGYITLSEKEKEELSKNFSYFQSFDSHYEPSEYWTDQDYHQIIFNYKNESDTVGVYDFSRAEIPGTLHLLIQELQELHKKILE